jgi:hypothetical protein
MSDEVFPPHRPPLAVCSFTRFRPPMFHRKLLPPFHLCQGFPQPERIRGESKRLDSIYHFLERYLYFILKFSLRPFTMEEVCDSKP